MNVPRSASERTKTRRVQGKNNMFRGTPRRHCRSSVVQWQLPSLLACPRNGGARQRCASSENLTASVTTIPIGIYRRTTRRPAPPGDRGSKPPANFRPFPSLPGVPIALCAMGGGDSGPRSALHPFAESAPALSSWPGRSFDACVKVSVRGRESTMPAGGITSWRLLPG